MKIVKIETIPVNIPNKVVLKMAPKAESTVLGVIVKVYTDEGIIGLGEANPLRAHKEPLETVVANIDKYFAPALIGADPFDIEGIMAQMDVIIRDQPSSKYALVTALYDIIGKALEVPIYKLIGGCINKKMPVAQAISFGKPEEVADEALEWVAKGVKAFKVKIGRTGDKGSDEDLKALEAIRNAVGPEVSLRVDANESYAYKVGVLRKMEEFGLDLIEQPAPRDDFVKMRRITQALDTPVLVDQSIFSLRDAIQVIENEAADVLMVKNYDIGGFYRAKQLLGIIEATNKANYLEGGSETGIGTAASLHLMASTRVDYWGCLNGPLIRTDDLLKEPLRFEDGCWEVPDKPGLGVELDEQKLKFRMIS